MSERDELADLLMADELIFGTSGMDGRDYALAEADAVLAAGFRKPRTITTAEEANELPDRSAFITPGQIIFRKWEDYYSEGKHAWERELGQVVPAELLDEDSHLPATVLHDPSTP